MKKSTIQIQSGIYLLILAGLFNISLNGKAQTDPWTNKTPIPTGRGFTGGAVVDDKIYVIGGFPSHYAVTGVNEMYDPATDTWTEMDSLPVKRCGHATCAYDGKIYVFGGLYDNPYAYAQNNVHVYDPQTNTWTQKADMPYKIAFPGIAVLNDTIYLIGGTTNVYTHPVSTVMAYDPVSETWSEKASMLDPPRAFVSACVLNGKIYIFGGGDENLHHYAFDNVEVYDPVTNSWTVKANMPKGRMAIGTCAKEGKIYAVGGWSDNLVTVTKNELYDPVSDTWTTKSPLHKMRHTFFFGLVGDKMYAIAGTYPEGGQPIFVYETEEYDPAIDTVIMEPPTPVKDYIEISFEPFILYQNYPNPCNSGTTIRYNLASTARIVLTVYDLLGQEVQVLVNEKQLPGEYEVTFDADGLTDGVYYYRIDTRSEYGPEYSETKKLILHR
jgi:kelch-like protein 17 (actinfilin)/kelch-like protein 20